MKDLQNDTIRILIVDDEQEACDNLESILYEHTPVSISIVGKAMDTRQAEELIAQTKPDLVFLDIHMPYENGLEFLLRIGQFSFEVIFATAFDEYALKAFKLNAIDYILKPISIPEIVMSLEKTREKLVHKRMLLKDPQFYSKILSQVYSKTSQDQFTFRDKNTVNIVSFEKIIYMEGMCSYSRMFYLVNGEERSFILSHSLAEYEQLLPRELFYRIHKSYLVNRTHIANILRDDQPTTLLSNKRVLPVGRRRLSGFMSFLNGSALL